MCGSTCCCWHSGFVCAGDSDRWVTGSGAGFPCLYWNVLMGSAGFAGSRMLSEPACRISGLDLQASWMCVCAWKMRRACFGDSGNIKTKITNMVLLMEMHCLLSECDYLFTCERLRKKTASEGEAAVEVKHMMRHVLAVKTGWCMCLSAPICVSHSSPVATAALPPHPDSLSLPPCAESLT